MKSKHAQKPFRFRIGVCGPTRLRTKRNIPWLKTPRNFKRISTIIWCGHLALGDKLKWWQN